MKRSCCRWGCGFLRVSQLVGGEVSMELGSCFMLSVFLQSLGSFPFHSFPWPLKNMFCSAYLLALLCINTLPAVVPACLLNSHLSEIFLRLPSVVSWSFPWIWSFWFCTSCMELSLPPSLKKSSPKSTEMGICDPLLVLKLLRVKSDVLFFSHALLL